MLELENLRTLRDTHTHTHMRALPSLLFHKVNLREPSSQLLSHKWLMIDTVMTLYVCITMQDTQRIKNAIKKGKNAEIHYEKI